MKKRIAVIVILVLTLVMSMFTGCAGEGGTKTVPQNSAERAEKEESELPDALQKGSEEPLRVVFDLEHSLSSIPVSTAAADLFNSLKESGKISEVEVQCIAASGADRESAIQRIRTELMAGEGPDVFIVNCVGGGKYGSPEAPLFPMPEKTMEAGLFLPLDEYIAEKTEYADWDKMTDAVMSAGRNEEGQQFIPLTYTFPVIYYRKSDFSHTPSAEMTWQAMLEDEALRDAAVLLGDGDYDYYNRSDHLVINFYLNHIIGDLADHKEEKLLFTEEELLTHVNEILELRRIMADEKLYEIPDRYEGYIGRMSNSPSAVQMNGLSASDSLTMVPLYSDDGGITAEILSYAAVNRNTKKADEAFAVIDYLLSKNAVQNSPIYSEYLFGRDYGMPMDEEMFNETHPFGRNIWKYSAENFEMVCALREEITNAEFADELSRKLESTMAACMDAARNGEDHTKIVSEAYNTMKQMIAE